MPSEHLVIVWVTGMINFCPVILPSFTFYMPSKPTKMCVTLLNKSKCHQHLGIVLQIKILKCFTFGNVLSSAIALKLLSTMICSYINSAGLSFTRLQLNHDSGFNSYAWRNGMFLHDTFACFWARCSSLCLSLWQMTHLLLTSKLSSTCGWTLLRVIFLSVKLSCVPWGINISLTFSPSFYSGSVVSLSRSFKTIYDITIYVL